MQIEIDIGDLVRNKTTGYLYEALESSHHPAGDWCDSEIEMRLQEITAMTIPETLVISLLVLREEFHVLVPMALNEF